MRNNKGIVRYVVRRLGYGGDTLHGPVVSSPAEIGSDANRLYRVLPNDFICWYPASGVHRETLKELARRLPRG